MQAAQDRKTSHMFTHCASKEQHIHIHALPTSFSAAVHQWELLNCSRGFTSLIMHRHATMQVEERLECRLARLHYSSSQMVLKSMVQTKNVIFFLTEILLQLQFLKSVHPQWYTIVYTENPQCFLVSYAHFHEFVNKQATEMKHIIPV